MLPLFPRGKDIVTRMPIKLRLMHMGADELATFCSVEGLAIDSAAFYIRAAICPFSGTPEADAFTPWEGPFRSDDERVQSEQPTVAINKV